MGVGYNKLEPQKCLASSHLGASNIAKRKKNAIETSVATVHITAHAECIICEGLY